jgi:hypothetical protein
MDQAWNHMGMWWLAGMESKDTADWFPYVLSVVQGADVTNEYLMFGLRAGLVALVLLIALLTKAFGRLGDTLKEVRRRSSEASADEGALWGLGVALFVHAVSWLGVGYFDQSYVIWILHIAAIAACVGSPVGVVQTAQRPAADAGKTRKRDLTPRLRWGRGFVSPQWLPNSEAPIAKGRSLGSVGAAAVSRRRWRV